MRSSTMFTDLLPICRSIAARGLRCKYAVTAVTSEAAASDCEHAIRRVPREPGGVGIADERHLFCKCQHFSATDQRGFASRSEVYASRSVMEKAGAIPVLHLRDIARISDVASQRRSSTFMTRIGFSQEREHALMFSGAGA